MSKPPQQSIRLYTTSLAEPLHNYRPAHRVARRCRLLLWQSPDAEITEASIEARDQSGVVSLSSSVADSRLYGRAPVAAAESVRKMGIGR